MKAGRNDLCICGSGKKYKKCCLNSKTIDEIQPENLWETINDIRKKSKIKQCIHPNKDECKGKIINAHAIQNNKILNKLSVNGMVQTMDGVAHLIFQNAQSKGRKIATTFTGFCSYHDQKLFQEIEHRDFTGTKKQLFLFAYRTFAWHYHKKEEQAKRDQLFQQKVSNKKNSNLDTSLAMKNLNEYIKNESMCIRDNNIKKEKFNAYLLSEQYDAINSSIWEIPYEVKFAVSTMLEIEHGLDGQEINSIYSKDPLKSIYLNIFPSSGKSFCIWSWLVDDNIPYLSFTNQFFNLEIKDRINYLNNVLPRWTDAIVISPRLWDKWGEGIQEALIAHANFDILYRALETEELGHSYTYMDTPWDLFEQLN